MELLLKSSENIKLLIETVKLHEQNITHRLNVKSSCEEADVSMNDKIKELSFVECAYGSVFNPEPMFCPLTRVMFKPEDRVILIKECKHLFSKEFFLNWINFHNQCPRCKCILF